MCGWLKHTEKERHCRNKVPLQFKETENGYTAVKSAIGIKHNLVDNIYFVHLI